MGYSVIITFMNTITLKDIVYFVMVLLFQKISNENVFAHKASGTIVTHTYTHNERENILDSK